MKTVEPHYFQPAQAEEVAAAFGRHGVEYLFIGKSGAILLGYPSATQDVDLFPKKSVENGERILLALADMGFPIDAVAVSNILAGTDFVQITSGPFDLDLVFAPDGIENFEIAYARMIQKDQFPIANLRDIIASKKAAHRRKDLNDLPLLEQFADEYERSNRQEPKSAYEIAIDKLEKKEK